MTTLAFEDLPTLIRSSKSEDRPMLVDFNVLDQDELSAAAFFPLVQN